MAKDNSSHFPQPDQVLNHAEVIVSEQDVDNAISKLAEQINSQHYSAPLQIFCIMNGGLYFAGQLLRLLTIPVTVNYLHATRYGDKTQGQELQWLVKPKAEDIHNQPIMLLDDIFDEGITLEAIAKECEAFKPSSLQCAVLVDKNHQRKPESGFKPEFVGLSVPDRYIFGCGMDYKGLWRNLPAIYAI
ncbi:hypoxanthine-guanine phosphoribosyltransferase [Kangiella koreensis]|uniref:Phosphoribosyltransferase n=1 Tax=Kangiella koreensis (strain DSM 16069 / JCM 12317 / KCTC 12182 / SW-125) TaxID=523791 RepID=C7RCV4_KANKD|nr:hypoxanthine-guanine phosphoribosyltransferase [Kangiella koreensis]ACV27096.1 phosphoribosyltransferase [Kangiella koreensis DSM 16069]